MRNYENVEYYSISEIVSGFDHELSESDILNALETGDMTGTRIDGEWYSSKTAIHYYLENGNDKRQYRSGIAGFDFSDLKIDGLILDIGAGGESVIEQCFGEQVVGIAPEEHITGLIRGAECKLKLTMDARDMKFLDESFDNITSFYTILYIPYEDYEKVFEEVYRVLKKGGVFYLWDLNIEARKDNPADVFLHFFEIRINDNIVKTGYGTRWSNRVQNLEFFKELGIKVGFNIKESYSEEGICHVQFLK